MKYYLKKHWKFNFLTILFLLIQTGSQTVVYLLDMQQFQKIIELDFKGFMYYFMISAIVFIIMIAANLVANYFQGKAVRNMNNSLRQDIAAVLINKDHLSFHEQASGEYLSWFTNDVSQIEKKAWGPFYNIVVVLSSTIFSVIALFTLHWSLLVVSLIFSIIMMAAPKIFEKRINNLGEEFANVQAASTDNFKELLKGFDVLRFFNHEHRFFKGINSASDNMEKAGFKLSMWQTVSGDSVNLFSLFSQIAINALIAFLSIKGIIIQSAISGGGNLCSTVINGVANLSSLRISFYAVKPYFEKITVHADKDFEDDKTGMLPLHEAITLENVDFQYENKPVIKNMSLNFEVGKKYALVGPSGGGKSTLLKLILGWLPDYKGSIRFDGKDAKEYTTKQLQKQMSYIEQDVFLFNTTIKDNITLGEDFTDAQLKKALHDSALEGDLPNFENGLDTVAGEDGNNLSGGQKQRVALARALIHNRSILLVDEGTSALDKVNADIVEKSLLANPDLTLILVSHHLSDERKGQFDAVYEIS